MLKYQNWWVPEGNYGKRFFEYDHSAPTIAKCVEACGKRLRVAIDGGAYVGTITMHLQQHFKLVHSFEPNPKAFACLERNVGFPTVVHNAALTDVSGTVFLGPLYKDKAFSARVSKEGTPVRGVAIDDMQLEVLDFLKLDVEGHEYEALSGAASTLLRCRPVIMIEEKLDPVKRATLLLTGLGMKRIWKCKHDYIFTW